MPDTQLMLSTCMVTECGMKEWVVTMYQMINSDNKDHRTVRRALDVQERFLEESEI